MLAIPKCPCFGKKNRPYSDFVWLNDLDVAKGLEVQPNYTNVKAAVTFTNNIATTELNKVIQEVGTRGIISLHP